MSYPETLIVVITSHGKILTETDPVSGDIHPQTVALPAGMTLTKISAVSAGICNFLSATVAEKLVRTVEQNVHQHALWLQTNRVNFANFLGKQLNSLDTPDLRLYAKTDTEVNEYQYQHAKRYNVSTFSEAEPVLNKEYSINTLQTNSQDYLNKIIFLNLCAFTTPTESAQMSDKGNSYHALEKCEGVKPTGAQDFFSMMDIDTTNVNELVEFLEEKGVRNILLVDLACANYEDTTLSDRAVRALRYSSERTGLWGGAQHTCNKHTCNKHTCNKHTCTKRNKKRNKKRSKYTKKSKTSKIYKKSKKSKISKISKTSKKSKISKKS